MGCCSFSATQPDLQIRRAEHNRSTMHTSSAAAAFVFRRAVGDGDGELAGLLLQDGCFVPLK